LGLFGGLREGFRRCSERLLLGPKKNLKKVRKGRREEKDSRKGRKGETA